MRRETHAEWTKLRTVAGPGWLLAGAVVLTVALSAVAAAVVPCATAGCGQDAARISLVGVQLGQAMVALLAVVAVCGEYSTGMIRTSLAAMPRRATALAAKAVVVGGRETGRKRSVIFSRSDAPPYADASRKLVVSTTRVFPSHRPRASPMCDFNAAFACGRPSNGMMRVSWTIS
jgi:hypothetical protein